MPRKAQGARLVPTKRKGWSRTVYVIRYWDSTLGRTRSRSTGESERGEAESKFRRWLATQAGEAAPRGPSYPAERLIGDALELYCNERGPLTADPQRIAQLVVNLVLWWRDRTCDTITDDTCAAYVEHRLGQRRSIGTARRELGALRAALQWDCKKGRLVNPPHVWLPPAPPGRDRWLTRGEVAALLRAARREPKARHLCLFILVALYTGARRRAVLDLQWPQVDLVRERINFNPPGRVQTTKRRPVVPIPRPLLGFLRRAQARSGCSHVISYNGKPVLNVRRALATAARNAGLEGIMTHTFRHTTATWQAQAGVPMWIIGGYLGQTEAQTTERYGHHHVDYLRQAKEALE